MPRSAPAPPASTSAREGRDRSRARLARGRARPVLPLGALLRRARQVQPAGALRRTRSSAIPTTARSAFVDHELGRLLGGARAGGAAGEHRRRRHRRPRRGPRRARRGERTPTSSTTRRCTCRMILAGPGVPAGKRIAPVTPNTGLAATLLALAGAEPLARDRRRRPRAAVAPGRGGERDGRGLRGEPGRRARPRLGAAPRHPHATLPLHPRAAAGAARSGGRSARAPQPAPLAGGGARGGGEGRRGDASTRCSPASAEANPLAVDARPAPRSRRSATWCPTARP